MRKIALAAFETWPHAVNFGQAGGNRMTWPYH